MLEKWLQLLSQNIHCWWAQVLWLCGSTMQWFWNRVANFLGKTRLAMWRSQSNPVPSDTDFTFNVSTDLNAFHTRRACHWNCFLWPCICGPLWIRRCCHCQRFILWFDLSRHCHFLVFMFYGYWSTVVIFFPSDGVICILLYRNI